MIVAVCFVDVRIVDKDAERQEEAQTRHDNVCCSDSHVVVFVFSFYTPNLA